MGTSEQRELEVRYRGRIIEHLTVQTYQSPVAAIAEMVANGWDADATKVEIKLPAALNQAATLTVVDDGNGMTFEQCQDRYLEVGYGRRGNDPTATSERSERPLMGRKGIGKFAGFGIANVMVVDTVSRDTGERTRFRLDYDRIRGESPDYVDDAAAQIPGVKWWAAGNHDVEPGTRIELSALKVGQRPSASVMRRSLARRFLLLERAADFEVLVDGGAIADEDEGIGVQFAFPRDWDNADRPPGLSVDEHGWGKEMVAGHEVRWRFVFYGDTIKDEELRGVSVFAHGKLAQRPFFFDLGELGGSEGQHGLAYFSGTVDASFLDDADADLISIERQRVDWNDSTAAPLMKWGQERSRHLLSLWSKRRVEDKIAKLDKKLVRFADRLGKLPSRERKIVERAIRGFAQIRSLTDEQFTTLSEGTLTSWEGGRLKELIEDVADTGHMSEGDLLSILMEHQVLTALHTAEAVKAKQRVVQGLAFRIEQRELENAVRDYIAKNPWLIDPKWETFRVEKAVKTIVDKAAHKRFSDDMLNGRVDLVLSSGEQLLVLEFMRPGLKLDDDHLNRFSLYVNAIRNDLKANTGGPHRAVTGYLVADRIEEDAALVDEIVSMRTQDKFAMTWDVLLQAAAGRWGDLFEALVERAPDDPRIHELTGGGTTGVSAGPAADGDAKAA